MDGDALEAALMALAEAPGDERRRLALFGRLAQAELLLLLEGEPEGEDISPLMQDHEGLAVVQAFARAEDLAGALSGPASHAALPGRVLAQLLAGQGIGLRLTSGPVSLVLTPQEIDWLAGALSETPAEEEARPTGFAPPLLPPGVTMALAEGLLQAAGIAETAWLAAVSYSDGSTGHVLAITGADPQAEAPLATALAEGAAFAGGAPGRFDVAFLTADHPILQRLRPVALQLDIPEVEEMPEAPAPAAPGSDPDKPPRLR